jgi:hypothetical protein
MLDEFCLIGATKLGENKCIALRVTSCSAITNVRGVSNRDHGTNITCRLKRIHVRLCLMKFATGTIVFFARGPSGYFRGIITLTTQQERKNVYFV